MSIQVKNIVEDIVVEVFNEVKGNLDCCTCTQCCSDIVAYALNQIKPKYVSTEKGALYSKSNAVFDSTYKMEIIKAIAAGAKLVKERPRH